MRSPHRVALVLPGFCADESDPCIPVITAFARAVARHVDLSIYTGEYPFRHGAYSVHGIPVYCGGGARGKGARALGWIRASRRIAADHRREPFDLIHAFWAYPAGVAALATARRLSIPFLLSLAGGELAAQRAAHYGGGLRPISRRLIDRAMAGADAITVGSSWLCRMVPQRHRARTRTLPLGLDRHRFPPGPPRDGARLLAVGALIPIKDYPTMLEAVAQAYRVRKDLTLSIVGWDGDRDERARITDLIGRHGLGDAVTIRGSIDYAEMPEIFRTHDMLLHASRHEAQGMAILEALASGMPVIATDVGIVPELPERLVRAVGPGDADAMGRAIIDLLADRHYAERAHTEGPDLVRARFDAEDVAEEFVALYRGMGGDDRNDTGHNDTGHG